MLDKASPLLIPINCHGPWRSHDWDTSNKHEITAMAATIITTFSVVGSRLHGSLIVSYNLRVHRKKDTKLHVYLFRRGKIYSEYTKKGGNMVIETYLLG